MTTEAGLQIDGAIATLTINRPEQRNALSVSLLEALHARMDEVEAACEGDDSDAPRVLAIQGTGKAFCAGMDLSEVLIDDHGDRDLPLQLLSSLGELTLRIRQLPAVTIASINGAAIGGGCGLGTVCDLSITHDDSVMGFPEVDLGLCPAVVTPWLVRKIGAGRARNVLLQGGVMKGSRALEMGIVDLTVPLRDELDDAVSTLAKRVAEGGTEALRATKGLLNELDDSLNSEIIQRAAELSASVLLMPDSQARLRARKK